MTFDDRTLTALIDGTWPAAGYRDLGPFTLREGRGGGSRVSAATANGPATEAEIGAAEAAMRDWGQTPIFMIRPGDAALDAQLAARGYEVFDPVNAWACPVERLMDRQIPRVMIFSVWEPLAIQREIWAQGGIGPARLAVMHRARGPKTALLARFRDKPGGAAFVAVHDGVVMLHALEILPHQRKQGLGQWMMRGAAFWAAEQGAHTLAVVCTKANTGANALYRSLGMDTVGAYHYRRPRQET
ncbi:GNAT family N-acetyltransferase [Jhaorihella thermophila]|uniref:Acetyltransferase (GNAT) family protein n=1 Tax=Jhaorihella thermophila TaxID=488547 RepID=A0A1H5W8X4_9RHOB|nr:GNAT family N-acetyltransferase [Jhaorihella thermophila]SEF95706.1 Acetyltransferase (GNAT) family protein [Jhaorihella thermophila]